MKVAKTLDFFETEYAKAVRDLEMYSNDPREEILHQFRVELKKMRAVFFLMEEVGDKKRVQKWHQKVRRIFRKAGYIRELQLEKNWLNLHRKFDLLRHMRFEVKLARANESLQKDIPGMIKILRKVSLKIEHCLSVFSQSQADQYVKRKWRESLLLVVHLQDESHWHETRKKIKQFLYAKNWIPDIVYISGKIKKIFNQLNRLQDIIGKWHDLEMLLQKLNAFDSYTKGHSNLRREHQLAIKKITLEKNNLADEIRKVIDKIKGLMRAYLSNRKNLIHH